MFGNIKAYFFFIHYEFAPVSLWQNLTFKLHHKEKEEAHQLIII